MIKLTRSLGTLGLGLMVLVTSACSVDIDRNADGSLSVAARISAESLQNEIDLALRDPLIEDLKVTMRDSYVLVNGERRRLGGDNGDRIDEISFRLDLRAEEGVLVAEISDAEVNERPVDQARVTLWNERLARNLSRAAGRRPNSSLIGVQVTTDSVVMTWQVETARSRGD